AGLFDDLRRCHVLIVPAPPAVAVATPVATSIPSNVSIPSTEPPNLDDSDAGASTYGSRPRLRALWTLWSVEVRVLSGALRKPCTAGLSLCPDVELGAVRDRRHGCHVANSHKD